MPQADAVSGNVHMIDTGAGGRPGWVNLLGGPLLALGLWMIAQALLLPHEAETVRLSVITGAFAALLGGWLLAPLMRRALRRQRQDPAAPPAPECVNPPPEYAGQSGPEAVPPGLGCLLIPLGFLLVGPTLLYFYFSGVPTRRGNPVMPLVIGILFTAVGFLGILALGSLRRQSGHKWGRNDPRRLP